MTPRFVVVCLLIMGVAGWRLTVPLQGQADQTAAPIPKIWQGVYSAEQAARGRDMFQTTCQGCHGPDLAGGRGPALAGEPFLTKWNADSVSRLFRVIRETMPRGDPGSLTDAVALDLVAYVLQTNKFPVGSGTARIAVDALDDILLVARDGGAAVPNFSLVEVVGCLTRGANNTWLLAAAHDPVVTTKDTSSAAEAAAAAARPSGSQTYALLNVIPFGPASHVGQRMYAKGIINRTPAESLLNVTAMETIAPSCN
jgi:hypothetical protein